MSDLRQEVEELLNQKKLNAVGFHHTYQVNQLVKKAKETRRWKNLLFKVPFYRWQKTLADTQFVLENFDSKPESKG